MIYNIDTINEGRYIKMYIKNETTYYSEDNKKFKSIAQCREYENNFVKNSTIECWNFQGVKIDNLSKGCVNNISVIKLNNEKDKIVFNILFDNYDVFCPEKINTFYMWHDEYNKFMTSQEYEECMEASYFIIKELEAEE